MESCRLFFFFETSTKTEKPLGSKVAWPTNIPTDGTVEKKKKPSAGYTPRKFDIAPEKWWLEDYFPIIGKVTFQGLC